MTERENDATWEYFQPIGYFSIVMCIGRIFYYTGKKGPQKSTYWWALSYPGDIKLAATQEYSLDDHLV